MKRLAHSPLPFAALLATLAIAASASAALPPPAQLRADRADFAGLSARAIHAAQSRWWDRRRHWYDDVSGSRARYPLATIWSSVPLFEALDARAEATRTRAARAAVRAFAAGAERYFDPAMSGYGPYPGDRHRERTWFDDNGWWGLAFVDAYKATGNRRYLADAARALRFIATQGWAGDGGIWWNTDHPYKAGEALAAGSWLGAELYAATGDRWYRGQVERFIAWGDSSLWNPRDSLYARSDGDLATIPYVNGPMIAAHAALCQASGDDALCARAEALAARADGQFGDALDMGPQYDVIYVRALLYLYARDGDPRWYQVAYESALRARANSGDGTLFPRAWDGGSITAHQSTPGMLRTQAATAELFALLAAAKPPAG